LSQVSGGQVGTLNALADFGTEFGELVGQSGVVGRPVGQNLGDSGTVQTGVNAGEE
jgi:hypothetical protein